MLVWLRRTAIGNNAITPVTPMSSTMMAISTSKTVVP